MAVREATTSDRGGLVRIIEGTGNLTREEKDCALELLDIYLGNPLQKDYFFIVAATKSDSLAGYACYGKTPYRRVDLFGPLASAARGRDRDPPENGGAHRQEGARLLVAETRPSGLRGGEEFAKRGFAVESRINDFTSLVMTLSHTSKDIKKKRASIGAGEHKKIYAGTRVYDALFKRFFYPSYSTP